MVDTSINIFLCCHVTIKKFHQKFPVDTDFNSFDSIRLYNYRAALEAVNIIMLLILCPNVMKASG